MSERESGKSRQSETALRDARTQTERREVLSFNDENDSGRVRDACGENEEKIVYNLFEMMKPMLSQRARSLITGVCRLVLAVVFIVSGLRR